MIEGGCLCGRVRYKITAEPLFALHCHCRDCQRASGTGHVPIMGVPKTSFAVTGGPKSYSAAGGSGMKAIRNFCPDCGSLMFGTPEAAADLVTIYMGSLDDPSIRAPTYAQFTRDRVGWDAISGGLPEFHTAPPPSDDDV
jgi:hypothetical protein